MAAASDYRRSKTGANDNTPAKLGKSKKCRPFSRYSGSLVFKMQIGIMA
ncbi:MAG: hypothetical protein FWE67_15645 [Planctomycetaceae bacterium]|nr:hypothetical protein [Planctomycetaceae bacterium]